MGTFQSEESMNRTTRQERRRSVVGWIAVLSTLAVSSLWTFWGIMENFHEGWYSPSLMENLSILFIQYLSIPIVFTSLGLLSLSYRRVGFLAHAGCALFALWFFSGASFEVLGLLILIPFGMLGGLYYLGTPRKVRRARMLLVFIPLVITLSIGIPSVMKVARRLDDGYRGVRVIDTGKTSLLWAPRGPGWPDAGVSWYEASRQVRYLSEDGSSLDNEIQDIWRLPTVEEAVGSMRHHGEDAVGSWDEQRQKATYELVPDKETPLWDPHSPVIYYWCSETSREDAREAYIIVYDGGVYDKRKSNGQRSFGFRAVRDL